MRVAASAALVWGDGAHRAPSVHRLDPRGPMATIASRGPGRVGQPGSDRLVAGGAGRGIDPGEKRGSLTGPNPVDRGKPGSKIHVLSDRNGLPLSVAVSAANT